MITMTYKESAINSENMQNLRAVYISQLNKGGSDGRDELCWRLTETFSSVALKVARRYKVPGYESEDLSQEAIIKLHKALGRLKNIDEKRLPGLAYKCFSDCFISISRKSKASTADYPFDELEAAPEENARFILEDFMEAHLSPTQAERMRAVLDKENAGKIRAEIAEDLDIAACTLSLSMSMAEQRMQRAAFALN